MMTFLRTFFLGNLFSLIALVLTACFSKKIFVWLTANFPFNLVTITTLGTHSKTCPATTVCQCITNAIQSYIVSKAIFRKNYVLDDFEGCDSHDQAADSFHTPQHLFHLLGIDSAFEKDWPPSTIMVFLGILFNTVDMNMSVPVDKILKLLQSITKISLPPSHISCHTLQSLLGLMSYVTDYICPARIFMSAPISTYLCISAHSLCPLLFKL